MKKFVIEGWNSVSLVMNPLVNSGFMTSDKQFLFVTGQVEKRVEDIEALRVSSLNKFVGVHFSDLRSVDTQ